MKQRCLNPKSQRFDRYGGRGIRVCELWQLSFRSFIKDVGPRPSRHHSLERIDNNGNYEPGNVKWATKDEQNNNKTNNRYVAAHGERLTISQWSKKNGIRMETIKHRLDTGWSGRDAVIIPSEPRRWQKSPGIRMSEEQRNGIIAAMGTGLSAAAVGRRYEVGETTVRKLWRNEIQRQGTQKAASARLVDDDRNGRPDSVPQGPDRDCEAGHVAEPAG